MNKNRVLLAIASAVAFAIPASAEAAAPALRGSLASMQRQHEIAVTAEYPFVQTPSDMQQRVEEGVLVHVPGNAHYALTSFTNPYALAEVRMFIERLAYEYYAANGEKLVITSLVRPSRLQPANAHRLSVHPAGMAIDMRVPARASVREWLQETLLELESAGVLDVTREYRPPHYHVALYPAEYRAYVTAKDLGRDSAAAAIRTAIARESQSYAEKVPAINGDAAQQSSMDSGAAPRVQAAFPFLAVSMLAGAGVISVRRRSRRP